MRHLESGEQQALFTWAYYRQARHPELELMYHIPNGGQRNVKEAVRLKREGVKAGIPDICLPVARKGKHGLFIELKSEKGHITLAQKLMLKKLEEQGYAAEVCYGYEAAVKVIDKYLEGEA